MASSMFTNAYLIDFESVLNIPDNEGMQHMLKALESSGLRGFLGCKSMLYEPELEQFFDTALIQGGDITGAISGKYFIISPSRFAGVFELPTEGLSDFSDVPKNLLYDARKLFSKSGEPVVPHGKKKLLKYEYRLLNDILAKSIMVNWSKVLFGVLEEMVDRTVKKAKGYGAQISVFLNSVPALTMGEATPFPSSKILSPKTVLTYITTNQTSDTRGKSDEGGKTPVAIVKRASKSKKKSEPTSDATVEIVSEVVELKKRPAVEGSEPVVPKKRRTTKGKASASTANMDMASVAQDAVPLQVIEPTPGVTAALPPVPKRKSRKRKLILSEGSDDDYVEENIDVASVKVAGVNVEESIENVSHVSEEQIFAETNVGDIAFGDSTADNPEELAQWLENYIFASVAQDAVPLQVIEPTPGVTAALPPVPKRKSRKRKLILSEGSDDDYVEENIDVASVKVAGVNVEESIENVSHVSEEQIFAETNVGDIAFGDSTADNPEELAQWLENYISEGAEQHKIPPPPSLLHLRRRPRAAADLRRKFVSGRFDEENPFVQNSSVLVVQPDEGVSVMVVDRIGDYLPQSTEKSRVLVIPVGARHKCQQVDKREPLCNTAAGSALPCAALGERWWLPRAFLLPTFAPPHSARLLRAMVDAATSCCAHDWRTSSMERRACRGARDFVDGGRRPAAASAMLR
ncbi:hypothetical protein F511_42094 [Dorcoceras hygrometricum]|uniref:Dystroglycan-like n=1 Tax=Dorcoceras hygrometricum TaxID=472368 RepID=A0A2Z7BMR6_9LAMI|nr:hypothetical protein F511_42094 [Dorcoceras hygrometricum]